MLDSESETKSTYASSSEDDGNHKGSARKSKKASSHIPGLVSCLYCANTCKYFTALVVKFIEHCTKRDKNGTLFDHKIEGYVIHTSFFPFSVLLIFIKKYVFLSILYCSFALKFYVLFVKPVRIEPLQVKNECHSIILEIMKKWLGCCFEIIDI